ncbi:MAG: hypothetical protein V7640_4088 [Betaproteobacteria bacterium]|jgi:hypothetical protein
MVKAQSAALVIVSTLACSVPALAQDTELGRVREEMKQLQRNYEERMQALEKRLTDAESRAARAEKSATQAEQSASQAGRSASQAEETAVAAGRRSGENAFNPAISLILQGTWARTSQDPNNFFISGFVPSGGEVGPPKRSFGLGESELAVTANIDPFFRGVLIASLTSEKTVEVEEAYFQTLALSKGFTVKAGRFLSGIGYQNEIHQHAWDFQDAPLAYKAFLGGRYTQDGMQVRWLAPTPIFLEFGGELASGESFPGNDRNKNGAGSAALFAHTGGDIGDSYAWRTGISYLRTSARNRSFQDVDSLSNPVTNSFTGRARVWILDGVLKWAPNGNSTQQNVKLQAEYFRSAQDGTLTYDDSMLAVPVFGTLADSFRARQSGWYAQGVWQFMPRWRVGYRYDALQHGNVDIGIVNNGLGPTAADFRLLAPYNPSRNTAMIDFSPSEFSRLRLQLAQDKSRMGATDNQVFIQYIHSLGPHGAHKF